MTSALTDPHPLTLVGLSGGVGTPSSTTAVLTLVAELAATRLREAGFAVVTRTIEVREIGLDATAEVLGGLRSATVEDALLALERADALALATPVFRGSFAGVFKTVLDLIEPGALREIPTTLIATTGSVRHTLVTEHAMRPVASYLGALTMPTTIVATPEDLVLGRATPHLAGRIERAAGELARAVAARATDAGVKAPAQ